MRYYIGRSIGVNDNSKPNADTPSTFYSNVLRVLKEFNVDLTYAQPARFYYSKAISNRITPVRPACQIKWDQHFRGLIWSDIWSRIHSGLEDPVQRDFYWRTAHLVLNVNSLLNTRNPRIPATCSRCKKRWENLSHALVNCSFVAALWRFVLVVCNRIDPSITTLSESVILLGETGLNTTSDLTRYIISAASSISKSLCELFNKSLVSGKLPDEWKLSHIIPIPKKCPNDEVTNYRPISLLSVVSKVLERCIYNQLIVHVSSQLHHLQFGFLRGKSTTSQLLHVINEISKALENREQIDSIYLDFAKAFDKVDHILLLKKLRNFGITGKLLNWLNNYLSNRLQKVTVLGSTSQPLPILSGVPQGSILGPLLFLVFVNDLPDSISRQSSVALFADDTKWFQLEDGP